MKRLALGTSIYILCSFLVQALSHYVINVDHYASISFLRPEPFNELGIATMMIQGAVLSYLYGFYQPIGYSSLKRGWVFGMMACLFLVGYIALVEPAKYSVPSIPSWILIESSAGFIQFSLFGIFLGLLFPTSTPSNA